MKKTIKETSILAILVLLGLAFMLGAPTSGVVAVPGLTINQLITSGQSVTLQAPEGDYYYEWTADVGGATIASGDEQRFTFTAPQVTQDEGSKTMIVTLLMRTVEGGCVNSASTDVNVYPLPVCGIGGPAEVGPYEKTTYSYTGGTTGTITYEWSVDGTAIQGSTGSEVVVDWSNYDPGKRIVGLSLTKDYSDVAPGSTNPFRTIACSYPVNVTYTSGLELTKTPSVTSAVVGDTVTYTYVLNNVGSIGINDLKLNDDRIGDIPLSVTSLLPGESTTVTSDYLITEASLPGPLRNNATATGNEDRTDKPISAEANASIDLTYTASLQVTKVPSVNTAAIGDTIEYKYSIKNTGTVTLNTLALTDNLLGSITLDKQTIAPGESANGTASHTVVESDLPGPLTNLATVTAKDSQDNDVTGEATASVDLTYAASMQVTKVPSVTTAAIGDTIEYKYSIKNTGTVTLNTLALTDNLLGSITLDKQTIAPGESANGTASHTVVESDLPGPLTNLATVTAKDSQDNDVTGETTASVDLTYTASLQVTKVPSPKSAKVGETITYNYTVKNTGTTTIRELTLNDDKLGTVELDKTELAPGESISATITYTITADDAPGPIENTATSEAKDALRETITSEAKASVAITRGSIEPILECVYLNDDEKSYTAFFGYNNPNDYTVTIPIGNDNKITPQPEDQGQPTKFEPGQHTAILAISSDANAIVWHLDGQTATANKNSQRCSVAPCGIFGSPTLCTNKEEEYEYTPTEDSGYSQTYEWFMDGESVGDGRIITLYGGDYDLGEHTLSLKVTRSYLDQVWSVTECSMTVKVIPEPVLDIVMIEE
ncbi:MAG: hypothetical protein HPY61_09000 [Methanotrichaceae archaeon]|nr:hypothetical protein [Methanotrichaceae archaeon]